MIQNDLTKFIALIPVAKLQKAMALFKVLGPLPANQLTMDKVHEVFALFDRPVPGGRLTEILHQAASADPDVTISAFVSSLANNGTLEAMLQAPNPQTILHRCRFCDQPQEVDVSALSH